MLCHQFVPLSFVHMRKRTILHSGKYKFSAYHEGRSLSLTLKHTTMDKILSSLFQRQSCPKRETKLPKERVSQEPTEEEEEPQYPWQALISWVQTNHFNVMPSTKIPKHLKLESGKGEIKAKKKKDVEVKVLKLEGMSKIIQLCMSFVGLSPPQTKPWTCTQMAHPDLHLVIDLASVGLSMITSCQS